MIYYDFLKIQPKYIKIKKTTGFETAYNKGREVS